MGRITWNFLNFDYIQRYSEYLQFCAFLDSFLRFLYAVYIYNIYIHNVFNTFHILYIYLCTIYTQYIYNIYTIYILYIYISYTIKSSNYKGTITGILIIYIQPCNLHHHHVMEHFVEYSYHPKNFLSVPQFLSLPFHLLTTSDLFSVIIVFFFQDFI